MATTDRTPAPAIPLSPGAWNVDPARSELGFRTRAMGLFPVRGRYSGFEGELRIDDAGNARGTLRVEAETISTGIKKRDTHLRSKDFFHVEVHPHMSFELGGLAPDANGTMTLTGTLHIRDQQLPISTPVTVSQVDADGLRIAAEFAVDHRAAGFEFKHLPRTVRIDAALTLTRSI